MRTVDKTLQERGERYGSYVDVSQVSLDLFTVISKQILQRDDSEIFTAYQVEAMHMICNKMARIVCGDPMYADNWHDISGYARLVENEIAKV